MTQPMLNTGSIAQYVRDTFRLIRPFWLSGEKLVAWSLLLAVIASILVSVGVSAKLSFVFAEMMDGLNDRDMGVFKTAGLWYLGWVALGIVITLARVIFGRTLTIIWRRWLTGRFINKYLANRLYNQMELKDYGIDNPDQRMSEDMEVLCDKSLGLILGMFHNLANIVTFAAVMWAVSGALDFSWRGQDFSIPGYMMWLSVSYAIFVTWLVHKVAGSMTGLEFRRRGVEANFRFSLTRIRENAESIALIGGETRERASLGQCFSEIWKNWVELLKVRRNLNAVQSLTNQLMTLLPLVAAMPGYFAGTITFGGLLQLQGAFITLTRSLEWFANYYQKLAEWKSSVDRILTLEVALDTADKEHRNSAYSTEYSDQEYVAVQDLVMCLPNGKELLNNTEFVLHKGLNTIVTGTSGVGKSTLFRAISGLWVWGQGRINLPSASVMFVPQRPYLPEGTLKEALCYPHLPDDYSDEEILDIMQLCCFGKFSDRLSDTDNWSRTLSGGEQQRIGFIRALLAKPEWLFLDEATSALDTATEKALYMALAERLPDTTVVSIAHRESLRQFHSQHLRLDSGSEGISLMPIVT